MAAESFNVGAVVDYACDEGHLLVGPTTRTCLDTGFYNEFPPVCKRKLLVPLCQHHLSSSRIGLTVRVYKNCLPEVTFVFVRRRRELVGAQLSNQVKRMEILL